MSEFGAYLKLGFQHILDVNGYDHILFLIALCAVYSLRDLRRVVILVTAFTVGHSLTLALATLDYIRLPSELVEVLIAATILITAISNLFVRLETSMFIDHQPRQGYRYAFAGFFGLIHGLGFSNFLRAMLGTADGVTQPLLAFNLGIELGQILIVFVLLVVGFLLMQLFRVALRDWNLVLSGAAIGISLLMLLERL